MLAGNEGAVDILKISHLLMFKNFKVSKCESGWTWWRQKGFFSDISVSSAEILYVLILWMCTDSAHLIFNFFAFNNSFHEF